MAELYPPAEPHAAGLLDVGDGNHVHWRESGNPSGTTALLVHGGPGGGCPPDTARRLNPSRYRIIAFDQRRANGRGSARSYPRANRWWPGTRA